MNIVFGGGTTTFSLYGLYGAQPSLPFPIILIQGFTTIIVGATFIVEAFLQITRIENFTVCFSC